ncbi:hypothetical protein Pint_20010 [Pistacia integerrima]|uniref:Uncharacterized protein n=1 Tax=Pistacia integerrima TaxID=434235 RepID=A0ACC0X8P5_9ROSI|nr:hypothetical protein Pint_20010 [Pistacia integerrima]
MKVQGDSVNVKVKEKKERAKVPFHIPTIKKPQEKYNILASRVLKLERNSLEYLLQHFCGVTANKEYQDADWRLLLLPNEMLSADTPVGPNLNGLQGYCQWRDAVAGAEDESTGYILPIKTLLEIGVEGIMAAYANALHNVSLAGPTLFGQVINMAAQITGQSLSHDSSKYFVLLIITDGVLTDLQETKDALVRASGLPLSILNVGVGGADFTQMEILEADNGNWFM